MCARAIQPSHIFHFNQLFYISDLFQTLERIILCDGVCKGHTAIPQISFQSLTSGSSFRLLISIILCDCVCKGHKAISRISLKSVTSVSYLSIGQLIMFDNTRFEFNLDSFFLPSKIIFILNFVIISCLRTPIFY